MILVADGDEFARTGAIYRRLLLESRVDGLILASVRTGDEVLAELDKRSLPYVFLNRRPDGSGVSVSADDEAGMALGVEHLASARPSPDRPHRRPAGRRHRPPPPGRLPECGRAARARGASLAGRPRRLHRARRLRGDGAPAPAHPATDRGHRLEPHAAVGALSAARRAGVDVPADLSIVAFHDAALAEYLIPAADDRPHAAAGDGRARRRCAASPDRRRGRRVDRPGHAGRSSSSATRSRRRART